MQISIDGFIAGPNFEMDWVALPWHEDLNQYVTELTKSIDTVLLGRKLAEGFIPYWASVANDPNNVDLASGVLYTNIEKIVFTKTLQTENPIVQSWSNTQINSGNLYDEVSALKKAEGNDIIVYGGATFVSSLLKENLIDELFLFINPMALGRGQGIFQLLQQKQPYKLIDSRSFDCEVVVLHYKLP
ncbi:MAG: dihydrofolate reductase family protein [Saprospiraceae bacterium]